ncbi:MAG: hypothetical protein RLZZ242_308 [Bacteroidota bacterium]|jgi:hypothetical protein
MKTTFFSLIALLVSTICFSQQATLVSDEPVINFGTLNANTPQPLFFKIINRGEETLYLSEARTSFGFDVIYIPEKMAPGAVDSVGFTIDLNTLRGPFRKRISVVTSSKSGLAVFDVAGKIER